MFCFDAVVYWRLFLRLFFSFRFPQRRTISLLKLRPLQP